ncbi:hypothetical protein Y032_0007g3252 [Ancylostoma ceylanicum]|uniref:Uncharacterized protein n=1 Tax=Ancylostoma ceylanicum TaxID=53326 RepID=A0A016VLL6_9BILA|nr:hypothetical protein Y032_0007g3252 [Ancylostoma ceylanicum]
MSLPNSEVDIRDRVVMPQCHFQLDIPCLKDLVGFSARASVDYSVKEHNICYIDKKFDAQVRCNCDTDGCSTNCTQIVAMWKQSRDYKTQGPHAECMNAYERACLANKLRTPIRGETIHNETLY